MSRLVGQVVQIKQPAPLARMARDWFAARYKINLDEAEYPVDHYKSIYELFIRRLKPGVRPIGEGVVHPCDAQLTTIEVIDHDSLVQAKGQQYSLHEFIKDQSLANELQGGMALTYYLCPTDYHRVHTPVDGQIGRITHVPGTLWPVNEWATTNIAQLFAVNERLIFHLHTALGPVVLVMVGATNVGRMSVSFDPTIQTNMAGSHVVKNFDYQPPKSVAKGDELGIFHMGSTVVMLYPPKFLNVLPEKGRVLVGQSI